MHVSAVVHSSLYIDFALLCVTVSSMFDMNVLQAISLETSPKKDPERWQRRLHGLQGEETEEVCQIPWMAVSVSPSVQRNRLLYMYDHEAGVQALAFATVLTTTNTHIANRANDHIRQAYALTVAVNVRSKWASRTWMARAATCRQTTVDQSTALWPAVSTLLPLTQYLMGVFSKTSPTTCGLVVAKHALSCDSPSRDLAAELVLLARGSVGPHAPCHRVK